MNETKSRFQAASEAAAQLIEDGYTDVSVRMTEHSPLTTVVFNTDMLKPASRQPRPDLEVEITLTATKKF